MTDTSSHFLPITDIPMGIPFGVYPQGVEIAGREAIFTVTVTLLLVIIPRFPVTSIAQVR